MSKLKDDKDIFRAVGYLVVYSGNLEHALTEVLELVALARIMAIDPAARQLGGKIAELEKFRSHLVQCGYANAEDMDEFNQLLTSLVDFKNNGRNPLIHGSIWSRDGRVVLTDAKARTTNEVVSGDIYAAADLAHDLHGGVFSVQFVLRNFLLSQNISCDFGGRRLD